MRPSSEHHLEQAEKAFIAKPSAQTLYDYLNAIMATEANAVIGDAFLNGLSDLAQAARPAPATELIYVKCEKCEGYHAKQDNGDCEAFCYTIEQIDEKRDRLAATGSKKTIAVEP